MTTLTKAQMSAARMLRADRPFIRIATHTDENERAYFMWFDSVMKTIDDLGIVGTDNTVDFCDIAGVLT